MMHVQSIMKEIDSLSSDEKAELVGLLLDQVTMDTNGEESAAGRRGLAAWTEATRGEDWAEFYPPTLRGSGSRSE